MMSLWDALRMNMMISYQELVRTFLRGVIKIGREFWVKGDLRWHAFIRFTMLRH
ncbi:Uncharacterised protein [Citrobacter youngae]|uniref:Uncharacterized protein n=1 Tax=Citrobacter youngae TaxID=133448 RepID=A0ABN7GUP0_9ENTR|nr:Uncharacterised protein [Citrobacter youngae]